MLCLTHWYFPQSTNYPRFGNNGHSDQYIEAVSYLRTHIYRSPGLHPAQWYPPGQSDPASCPASGRCKNAIRNLKHTSTALCTDIWSPRFRQRSGSHPRACTSVWTQARHWHPRSRWLIPNDLRG